MFRLSSMPSVCLGLFSRHFSTSGSFSAQNAYKLVVVGGGSGGCSVAAKFAALLPKGSVAVVEPSETHYYQPMWTLVGGGMKTVQISARPMGSVLPSNATWIKDRVTSFNPDSNQVKTASGQEVTYEYLVVAMGLQLNYDKIKGLPAVFDTDGVCSNYSPLYVDKTLEALRKFKKGNAIFTMPSTPVKCAGAPQKAMYISEEYLRKNGKRSNATVMYNSALGVIFGVPKYAEALKRLAKERNVHVNLRHELIEVKPDTKEAVFRLLDKPDETVTFPYEMLHICPPMSPPDILRAHKQLTNDAGFLDVDKFTLRHNKYGNIFGLGDCTSLPTSKTAAAVAAQSAILSHNLRQVMESPQKKPDSLRIYDGYTSCPLVTGYSKCILAEFDYDGTPLETFPLNQAKERRLMFHLKKDFMPFLYWNIMLKGWWNGPGLFRKLLHLGASR